jgi:transposase
VPIYGEEYGKRIKRGIFKRTRLNKIFNADLAGTFNILITQVPLGIWVTG